MVSLEIAAYSLRLEPRTLGGRLLHFFIFIFYYVFIVLSTKYFKSIKTTSSKSILFRFTLPSKGGGFRINLIEPALSGLRLT